MKAAADPGGRGAPLRLGQGLLHQGSVSLLLVSAA